MSSTLQPRPGTPTHDSHTHLHHAQSLHGLPDATVEERLIRGFKDQIHYLKLENDALTKKLESPKVESALHTDKLARDLHASGARCLTLEAELKFAKETLKERMESFERQAKAMEAEHGATLAALRSVTKEKDDAQALNDEVRSERDAVQRRLELQTDQLQQKKAAIIIAEKELADMSKQLAFADGEVAAANERKRSAEHGFQEQMALKERRIMDLETENGTLTFHKQGLEEHIKKLEALQMSRWLPAEEVALETKLQETQEAHKHQVERIAALEASLQEREQSVQRGAVQIDELQQENARFRSELAALRQEIDSMIPKVRDYDNIALERQQLQENMQQVQVQLQEALRQAEDARSDRDLLALRLGARLDTELLHTLQPEAQPDWLAPTARSVEEATGMLERAQSDAARAREGSQAARDDVRVMQLKLDNAAVETDRMERRIVEGRKQVDELNQKCADLERNHEEFMETFNEAAKEEARRIQAEYQREFQEEFDGLKASVAELMQSLEAKDAQIASLSQLQSTVETLAKFGSLSELGHTIAALDGSKPLGSDHSEP